MTSSRKCRPRNSSGRLLCIRITVSDRGQGRLRHYRIALDFALEAKCYAPENGVGVKELSRLISRLRHREFGILVTTSFLGHQAYQELRSDRHPVVVIAGADIAAILVKAGMGMPEAVRNWLTAEFSGSTRYRRLPSRLVRASTVPPRLGQSRPDTGGERAGNGTVRVGDR